MPYILSGYHLGILPSDGEGNVDWRSGAGTGAYKVLNFKPGAITELARFENYHRADLGHFDSVNLVVINDTSTRQAATSAY